MSLPELERIYGYNTLMPPKGLMTAFRVSAEDLERIDSEAKRFKMTRSEYIIRACLHELPVDDQALQAIYIRLERLEQELWN
jgi:hypothetical protein